MGVMNCDREGCTNILCDRYSNEFGYICNECFRELEGLEKPIKYEKVINFMNTPKDIYTYYKEEGLDLNIVFKNG